MFNKASREIGLILSRVAIATASTAVIQYLLISSLPPHEYGIISWATTVLSFAAVLSIPGLANAIPGATANGYSGNYIQGTKKKLLFSIIPAAGITLLGAYYHLKNETSTALTLYVLGVCAPGIWLDTWQAHWTGLRNFKYIAISTSTVRILQVLAIWLICSISPKSYWITLGNHGIIAVSNLLISSWVITNTPLTARKYSEKYKTYGKVNTRLYVIGTMTSQLDKLIIGSFLGMSSLATYAIAELIYQYLYVVPKSLLEQFYIARLATRPPREAMSTVKTVQAWATIFMLICCGLIVLWCQSDWYTNLAKQHPKLGILMTIFAINSLASAPLYLMGGLLKAHAMVKESEQIQYISSSTPLLLSAPACIFWGVEGLACTRLVQSILVSAYCIHLSNRISAKQQ